ncbi:hypothetical protein [Actinomadura chokoriensis]|uniref:hypothetical protein n=1 Tax=Actinomadura chokoriensis TaxID=454156 RepID=UPI0031F78542
MRRRALVWSGGGVAAAAAAGLGWYFAAVGLDKADKLASVTGVFVGLAGLCVAFYGALSDRTTNEVEQSGQHVRETTVGGNVTQIRGVGGSVRIGNVPAPSRPSRTRDRSAPAPGSGGQSVVESQISGDVTQVEGVGGDVDADR